MEVPALLVLTAHPDDESFFGAGTIAKYAAEGIHCTVVCGTRGERGATGDLCSIEELPAIREQELRDAVEILGADLIQLDYEDQKLAAAPPAKIRQELVEAIRRIRPEVVLTFDPNGANQHTDHVAISRFTSDAISAAADPRWYPELGDAYETPLLAWQSEIRVWELAGKKDLGRCPGIDYIIDVSRYWRTKEAALRAHRTQVAGFGKLFFSRPEETERILSLEAFRFGTGRRLSKRPLFDLFHGLA